MPVGPMVELATVSSSATTSTAGTTTHSIQPVTFGMTLYPLEIRVGVVQVLWGKFDDVRSLRFTRVQVVVFASVTAVVALRPPGDILSLTIFSGSLYAACFGAPLFAALFGWRGNAAAALWSMAVGGAVVVLWGSATAALPALQQVHQVTGAAYAGDNYVIFRGQAGLFQPVDHGLL